LLSELFLPFFELVGSAFTSQTVLQTPTLANSAVSHRWSWRSACAVCARRSTGMRLDFGFDRVHERRRGKHVGTRRSIEPPIEERER
jgi:hypothetical protein